MLLLKDVENIGMNDDIVEVKRGVGRWNLIPNKLAVYATEENLLKYGMDPKRLKEDTSLKVPLNVMKFLQNHEITLVPPSIVGVPDDTWVVTLHDVSEYFYRRASLRVPIDCMNIIECEDNIMRSVGKYTVQVTLNKSVTIDVPLALNERELDADS